MKISGSTTIFKNESGLYSTSVSNKKADGTYENMYISVGFKKGTEMENKTKIDILDGFISFYTNKANVKVPKLIIMEYTVTSAAETEETGEYITIDNEAELPF